MLMLQCLYFLELHQTESQYPKNIEYNSNYNWSYINLLHPKYGVNCC